jgi:hypothetical protein
MPFMEESVPGRVGFTKLADSAAQARLRALAGTDGAASRCLH